jgi:hypothetical protein
VASKGSLYAGIVLIAFGALFLLTETAGRLFAAVGLNVGWGQLWPLAIVLVGLAFWLAILVWWDQRTRIAGLAVPGTLILMNGLLLLYQSATGDWESWTYAWSLEPVFVGLGLLMLYALGQRERGLLVAALVVGGVGVVFLLIFGSVWGGWVIQLLTALGLVLAGVLLLMRGARQRPTSPFARD